MKTKHDGTAPKAPKKTPTLPVFTYERFRRLSPAQQTFLQALDEFGVSVPPGGQPDSGRHASAWYRTARSLVRLGLIRLSTVIGGGTATPLFRVEEAPHIPVDRDQEQTASKRTVRSLSKIGFCQCCGTTETSHGCSGCGTPLCSGCAEHDGCPRCDLDGEGFSPQCSQ